MDTSSQNSDTIASSLNVRPLTNVLEGEVVSSNTRPPSYDSDYELARENLIEISEQGMKALKDMMVLADQSQSARAYEVLTGLITNLAEVNERILDISKKHKELVAPAPGTTPRSVTNNLFVGSTAELQKLIKQATKEVNSGNDDVPGKPES